MKSKEIFCYYIEDNKLEEYFFKGKEKEFLNFISAEAKNKNQIINCYKVKNDELNAISEHIGTVLPDGTILKNGEKINNLKKIKKNG